MLSTQLLIDIKGVATDAPLVGRMTSIDLYSSKYVAKQLKKYYARDKNHFGVHIALAKELVARYGYAPPASVLDLGCSIGTFALEFARDGYETLGLDFDQKALDAASDIAQKEKIKVREWICADAEDYKLKTPVDIVICFDLLEHLSDISIKRLLQCVKHDLKKDGIFVFHTFPTEFDHIFYKRNWMCVPLIPFRNLSAPCFSMIVKWYAYVLNLFYLIRYGMPHKQYMQRSVHPNPLSEGRLKRLLGQAGFSLLELSATIDSVNPLRGDQGVHVMKYFMHQPAVNRSLYGVAKKV